MGARDAYCTTCGATQPSAASVPANEVFPAVSDRTASICCYIPGIGWIASVIVLASQRFRHNRTVRFHAFQGLYLFVAWLLDGWVLRPMSFMVPHFPFHALIELLLLGMSIFMIVKAAHDEAFSLPLFGELAHRSLAEE